MHDRSVHLCVQNACLLLASLLDLLQANWDVRQLRVLRISRLICGVWEKLELRTEPVADEVAEEDAKQPTLVLAQLVECSVEQRFLQVSRFFYHFWIADELRGSVQVRLLLELFVVKAVDYFGQLQALRHMQWRYLRIWQYRVKHGLQNHKCWGRLRTIPGFT